MVRYDIKCLCSIYAYVYSIHIDCIIDLSNIPTSLYTSMSNGSNRNNCHNAPVALIKLQQYSVLLDEQKITHISYIHSANFYVCYDNKDVVHYVIQDAKIYAFPLIPPEISAPSGNLLWNMSSLFNNIIGNTNNIVQEVIPPVIAIANFIPISAKSRNIYVQLRSNGLLELYTSYTCVANHIAIISKAVPSELPEALYRKDYSTNVLSIGTRSNSTGSGDDAITGQLLVR